MKIPPGTKFAKPKGIAAAAAECTSIRYHVQQAQGGPLLSIQGRRWTVTGTYPKMWAAAPWQWTSRQKLGRAVNATADMVFCAAFPDHSSVWLRRLITARWHRSDASRNRLLLFEVVSLQSLNPSPDGHLGFCSSKKEPRVVDAGGSFLPHSTLVQTGRGMLHVHVDPALLQFPQHLVKSFVFCLVSFPLLNPTKIVVLLVGWALPVPCHQSLAL